MIVATIGGGLMPERETFDRTAHDALNKAAAVRLRLTALAKTLRAELMTLPKSVPIEQALRLTVLLNEIDKALGLRPEGWTATETGGVTPMEKTR